MTQTHIPPFGGQITSSLSRLLPAFTFITGETGVGKTSLANLLFDEVKGLQAHSFAYPLRLALIGAFYDGDITRDLTDQTAKQADLPGFPGVTNRDFLNAFGDWFRIFLGPDAIGRAALHFCREQVDYFERFVFDDARRRLDIQPISDEFGPENCLLIELSRPGGNTPNAFVNDHIDALRRCCGMSVPLVNDRKPIDMLAQLEACLANPKEPLPWTRNASNNSSPSSPKSSEATDLSASEKPQS